ncbi:MAG: hypothetical protein UT37_C0001G0041 [Parcubacteria group bacterium GW2011_GWA2_39_18]|nr:MAG: hypothetical protein UT37_C0001G0041 [Parcubacteria group bacterium GW2011_GWA2_39_18]
MELTIYHRNIKKLAKKIDRGEDLLATIDNFLNASKIDLSDLNIALDCKELQNSLSCRAAHLSLEILKMAKSLK